MRYYQLYQSDPWYNTSNTSLEHLCREIFKTEDGGYDGYKKVWREIVFTWGDEELGGCAEVENSRLETTKIKLKAWDKEGGRTFKEEGEFWSWHQLYKWLSGIVWDFSPRFRYNPIYTHNTEIVADFWSFSGTFSRHRNMEEELKKMYVLISSCTPGLGQVLSVDKEGTPFEIYPGAETLTTELGVREIITDDEDELKKEEVVRIYIPSVSSYEGFVKGYGEELFRILSELDPD